MSTTRPALRVVVGGHVHDVGETETITVGRDPNSTIRVMNERVSRRHAVLRVQDGAWVFEDAGSQNGSFHNGRRIDRLVIEGNDTIQLRLGNPTLGPVLDLVPGTADPVVRGVAAAPVPSPAPPPGPPLLSSLPPDPTSPGTASVSRGEMRGTRTVDEGHFGQFTGVLNLPGKTVRIGRGPDNDIVVDDLLASRRHAMLKISEDQRTVTLADLGSQNGTFVNGERIRQQQLAEGDIVTIGHHAFRFVQGVLETYVDTGEVAFSAVGLTVYGNNNVVLLDDVSFALRERSFLAVVGPSGAGKSTLINALTGFRPADKGKVFYDDFDLYGHFEALQQRIGYVPQDDVLHPQLTVRRALRYAAELRFPSDVTPAEREREITEVLEVLGILERADLPINKLSGGQRKRVSIALELLTKPSLLILDEPTSGLDPGYEKIVMQLLRELADGGRTVIVVTHSLQSLALCDQVLFLAPGGKTAYFGPPVDALTYFNAADNADIFVDLDRERDRDWKGLFSSHPFHARYVREPIAKEETELATDGPNDTSMVLHHVNRSWTKQLSVLVRRYLTILLTDRKNVLTLALQAIVVGGLLLAIMPAGHLDPDRDPFAGRSRASMVLLALVLSITWIAASNSIREIVKEAAIYRRERLIGLSISAYVASKALVLGAITVVQACVLTLIALGRQGDPVPGVVFSPTVLEVMLGVTLAGIAALAIGLLISALVRTAEQALSIFPLLLIPQLVFAGPLFPVSDQAGLRELSYIFSAKWAFAALASTVDLNLLQGELAQVEGTSELSRWQHTFGTWGFNAFMLLLIMAIGFAGAWYALRRRDQHLTDDSRPLLERLRVG